MDALPDPSTVSDARRETSPALTHSHAVVTFLVVTRTMMSTIRAPAGAAMDVLAIRTLQAKGENNGIVVGGNGGLVIEVSGRLTALVLGPVGGMVVEATIGPFPGTLEPGTLGVEEPGSIESDGFPGGPMVFPD